MSPPRWMCLKSFSSVTRITYPCLSGTHFRPCTLGILSVSLIRFGQAFLPEAPGILGFTLSLLVGPRPACFLSRFWGLLPVLLWRESIDPLGKLTATHCLRNMTVIAHSKHINTYSKFYTIPIMTFQSRSYAHFRERELESWSLAQCCPLLIYPCFCCLAPYRNNAR